MAELCDTVFEELIHHILHHHLMKLRKEIERPATMEDFAVKGEGIVSILKKMKRTQDFKGCYVLLENFRPIYFGISKSVVKGLRQHVCGTTHFSASLAYKIAKDRSPHSLKRSAAMKCAVFKRHFQDARTYLRGLNVAFVEIDCAVERYLFEVYCAIKFGTDKWNSFEEH